MAAEPAGPIAASGAAPGGFEPTLAELRRRMSYKWRRYPADVLPAFVAELDYALAEPIEQVLAEALGRSDTGYAWPGSDLGEAFAGFAAARYGWTVRPADVTAVPDVMTGVAELLRRLTEPGDGVVINPPVYPPFFRVIREVGRRVVEAPLIRRPEGWGLDLLAVDAALDAGARAYLFCNPHNPTGRVFSRAELEQVAELAERHDAVVLADEIHAPLTLSGARHVPYLTLGPAAAQRGVVLTSASKGWNLPGLKCGLVIAPAGRPREVVAGFPEEVTFRTGHLGVLASVAAFRAGSRWLDELLLVLDHRRRLVADLLRDRLPQVGYVLPEASYLAWLDFRPLGLGDDPAAPVAAHGRVALESGLEFGSAGAGFARLTFGTSTGVLTEAVDRIARGVAGALAG